MREVRNHSLSHFHPKVHDLAIWLNSLLPLKTLNIPLFCGILFKFLLNNQQITEEIKKDIKICIEMNENENTTTQNLWDTVKQS